MKIKVTLIECNWVLQPEPCVSGQRSPSLFSGPICAANKYASHTSRASQSRSSVSLDLSLDPRKWVQSRNTATHIFCRSRVPFCVIGWMERICAEKRNVKTKGKRFFSLFCPLEQSLSSRVSIDPQEKIAVAASCSCRRSGGIPRHSIVRFSSKIDKQYIM